MSKDDIDKAVKEAEEYAAEDKKRREAVDIRNNADQMIYQTEKTMSEFGDKVTEEEKSKIEAAKEALKEALKGDNTDDIKAKQEERNNKDADNEVEDKLIDALVEKMSAEIPEVMYVTETENFVRDYDNRLRMQGLDLSTYCKYTGMTLDTIREQMRPRAEKQVKVRLVLEKIAKLEKLTALKKDIEAEYKRIAEAYNVPVDEVKKMIDAKDLGEDLKVKAAIDLVKEKAVITVA